MRKQTTPKLRNSSTKLENMPPLRPAIPTSSVTILPTHQAKLLAATDPNQPLAKGNLASVVWNKDHEQAPARRFADKLMIAESHDSGVKLFVVPRTLNTF
jgi:hypothetical protein